MVVFRVRVEPQRLLSARLQQLAVFGCRPCMWFGRLLPRLLLLSSFVVVEGPVMWFTVHTASGGPSCKSTYAKAARSLLSYDLRFVLPRFLSADLPCAYVGIYFVEDPFMAARRLVCVCRMLVPFCMPCKCAYTLSHDVHGLGPT